VGDRTQHFNSDQTAGGADQPPVEQEGKASAGVGGLHTRFDREQRAIAVGAEMYTYGGFRPTRLVEGLEGGDITWRKWRELLVKAPESGGVATDQAGVFCANQGWQRKNVVQPEVTGKAAQVAQRHQRSADWQVRDSQAEQDVPDRDGIGGDAATEVGAHVVSRQQVVHEAARRARNRPSSSQAMPNASGTNSSSIAMGELKE
jgi:hypothetical protein